MGYFKVVPGWSSPKCCFYVYFHAPPKKNLLGASAKFWNEMMKQTTTFNYSTSTLADFPD